MEINKLTEKIASVHSDVVIINDTGSALDFIAGVKYDHDCEQIIMNKEILHEDFFKLSTGLAGEVLQKFVHYTLGVAIVGDFSGYTSKPLHDFIGECNRGRHVFFTSTVDEALARLERL